MSARSPQLTAGVIGVGTLGDHHARIYSSAPTVGAVVLYDEDPRRSSQGARRWGGREARSAAELLDACDVVSICTPATAHRDLAVQAFSRGVHVLVEKPIAARSDEGLLMIEAADRAACVLQVG
ncbi:MAG: Gfo/Idh/MocA family oxidoreductase, partial [Candidatus Krumholzibacteria bacterium]|nr:Gfo/Idh/MocA family oxidoreductase [Candidatus Krumholzibacteria bacterium]